MGKCGTETENGAAGSWEGEDAAHTEKKTGGGVISQNIEEETEQKKGNLGERSEIFSFHPPSPPPPILHSAGRLLTQSNLK